MEESPFDFLKGVTVSRSYGAAAYLVGYGPKFEAACQKAPDRSFPTRLARNPDFLPGATREEIFLGQVKRFGGYDSHRSAENDLRKVGVEKIERR